MRVANWRAGNALRANDVWERHNRSLLSFTVLWRSTMAESKASTKNIIELATFYVGRALCGMDILKVQEINKLMEMTKVPQAPDYMVGILNLRGQIVTIIDLGQKLGLGNIEVTNDSRNIIVNAPGEHVGLLVSRISDVVMADPDRIEPAPANMNGVQGSFFTGVYKTENKLIGILNIKEVLRLETENLSRGIER
jgi:purine-binding chemotaxis protein CheW